ncbi:MAG: peptide deformylase [Bdellovibrionales bacterium]|nr:peptide deformylase [Bdellovibrionales bacterium]
MAILEVLKFPDSRLRLKGAPVLSVNAEMKQLAEDMLETMYSFKGIGLAAIQVNRQVRLLVTDTRPREGGRYKPEEQTELERAVVQPLVLFNPEIIKKEGKTTYDEGCLSVPTYYETVDRFDYVEVKALDIDGKEILIKTDGLLAICIQHEIDHLDGKLFIDRLSPIKSARIKSKIKKHGYPDPSHPESEEDLDEAEADEEREEHRL